LQNLDHLRPYVPASPVTLTIEVDTVDKVAEFQGRYGVEIVEPLKVLSRADDWLTAWNQIWHW
jgi:hypothetical protein